MSVGGGMAAVVVLVVAVKGGDWRCWWCLWVVKINAGDVAVSVVWW